MAPKSLGVAKQIEWPSLKPLALRPARCKYSWAVSGKSKWMTWVISGTSKPLADKSEEIRSFTLPDLKAVKAALRASLVSLPEIVATECPWCFSFSTKVVVSVFWLTKIRARCVWVATKSLRSISNFSRCSLTKQKCLMRGLRTVCSAVRTVTGWVIKVLTASIAVGLILAEHKQIWRSLGKR